MINGNTPSNQTPSLSPGFVSVIVLNWNGKEMTPRCLESLFRQTYPAREIILVDNGSTDGSFEMLQERYNSKLIFIRNERNLGFAEGVNIGICHSRGEFVALLNNDAVADPCWLEELAKKARAEESIGMCASKIYLLERDKILDNTGELLCWDGLARARGRLEKDIGQYDGSTDTFCPSGCAALYRREMLENIGFFDRRFFAYGDDIEVGLKGRMLGYKCCYVSTAVAYHQLSASSGSVSPLKAYYVERNRLWLMIKCFPLRYTFASIGYTFARYFHTVRGMLCGKGPAAAFVTTHSPWQLLGILIRVYLSTFLHLPYLLVERSKLQKKSKWKASDFRSCFQVYGMSARDASLTEVT